MRKFECKEKYININVLYIGGYVMTDWNQNGKYDISDSYTDYKIHKDMSSGNTSIGTFFLVMLMYLLCCIFPPFVFVILFLGNKE